MKSFLIVLQAIVSALFILSVLVQQKSSGFSSAIGGQSGATVQSTKRGAEKFVARASVVLAVIFVLLSLAFVFVP